MEGRIIHSKAEWDGPFFRSAHFRSCFKTLSLYSREVSLPARTVDERTTRPGHLQLLGTMRKKT
eukprot:scaffold1294_cov167-Amphora_coffeaeformis.AAC.25